MTRIVTRFLEENFAPTELDLVRKESFDSVTTCDAGGITWGEFKSADTLPNEKS